MSEFTETNGKRHRILEHNQRLLLSPRDGTLMMRPLVGGEWYTREGAPADAQKLLATVDDYVGSFMHVRLVQDRIVMPARGYVVEVLEDHLRKVQSGDPIFIVRLF